jgi:hypothetical protein
MSTRATIIFSCDGEEYYVYRHSDGYPENVQEDIRETVRAAKGRWSDPELGCMVTLFLARGYNYTETRLPDYEITPCFHGDESYHYYCRYNREFKEWEFGVSDQVD